MFSKHSMFVILHIAVIHRYLYLDNPLVHYNILIYVQNSKYSVLNRCIYIYCITAVGMMIGANLIHT